VIQERKGKKVGFAHRAWYIFGHYLLVEDQNLRHAGNLSGGSDRFLKKEEL